MDPKQVLHRYLDKQRKALVAKLEGASERDVRWPMTQTGTNLVGLVKHVASIELGYFGEVFDRPHKVGELPLATRGGRRGSCEASGSRPTLGGG